MLVAEVLGACRIVSKLCRPAHVRIDKDEWTKRKPNLERTDRGCTGEKRRVGFHCIEPIVSMLVNFYCLWNKLEDTSAWVLKRRVPDALSIKHA
jgi:hypothetical protein